MRREFTVLDAHVGGAPVRLITGGVPAIGGATMEKRRAWFSRHADAVRRAIMREPRGRRDLTGVLLTEPATADADAGLLFMDGEGHPAMNGAAVAVAAALALERRLITRSANDETERSRDPVRMDFDTVAGRVAAHVQPGGAASSGMSAVRVTGVPSFVLAGGVEVSLASRRIRADLAWCGMLHAIVDTELAGIPLTSTRLPDLRRLGVELCRAIDPREVTAPVPGLRVMAAEPSAVVFTGQSEAPSAHLRAVTVSGHGGCDPSTGMNGIAAVMAVFHAMGLLHEREDVRVEGLHGLTQPGRIASLVQVGDLPAIVPELEGIVWTTGEQTLFVDDDDPYRDGVEL